MLQNTGFVVGKASSVVTGEADSGLNGDGAVVSGDADGLGVGDAVPTLATIPRLGAPDGATVGPAVSPSVGEYVGHSVLSISLGGALLAKVGRLDGTAERATLG